MGKRKIWTEDRIETLKQKVKKELTPQEIADDMGVTSNNIYITCKNLGLPLKGVRKMWNDVRIEALKQNVKEGKIAKQIAKDMKLSLSNIYVKSKELGLPLAMVQAPRWVETELNIIRSGIKNKKTGSQIQKDLPHRTLFAIYRMAEILGLPFQGIHIRIVWQDWEEKTLIREAKKGKTLKEIGDVLKDRSVIAIREKAVRLEIKIRASFIPKQQWLDNQK